MFVSPNSLLHLSLFIDPELMYHLHFSSFYIRVLQCLCDAALLPNHNLHPTYELQFVVLQPHNISEGMRRNIRNELAFM